MITVIDQALFVKSGAVCAYATGVVFALSGQSTATGSGRKIAVAKIMKPQAPRLGDALEWLGASQCRC
jgi:hypothetical protein